MMRMVMMMVRLTLGLLYHRADQGCGGHLRHGGMVEG